MQIDLHTDGCAIVEKRKTLLSANSPLAYCYWPEDLGHTLLDATARNNRNRAQRLGYHAATILGEERNNYLDEIYKIHTSMSHRQGQAMKPDYLVYPRPFTEEAKPCEFHFRRFHGLFSNEGRLVAYIHGLYCGNLVGAGRMIGHGDYLKDGIMYLLWEYFALYNAKIGFPHLIYSRFSDGEEGLRYFKRLVGLSPTLFRSDPNCDTIFEPLS